MKKIASIAIVVGAVAVLCFTFKSAIPAKYSLGLVGNSHVNYYVSSSSGNDANDGKTTATPWKTLSKAISSQSVINAGDSVLFKKGDVFATANGLSWSKSGSASSPIVFGSYGSGNSPILTSTGSNLGTMLNVTGSYLTFDGFKVTDSTMSPTDRTQQAKIQYAFFTNGSYLTFSNLDISLVGVGIQVMGNNNTITKNKFSNLRMVVNTPVSVNANDDYGANPMVIESSDNLITYNTFTDCYAQSYDYGLDGGSVEMFGNCNRNKAMYNYSYNCNGFAEFGGGNVTSSDNVIAYNLMVNCGLISWINGTSSGGFSATVNRLQYYNNTIVSTSGDIQNQNACFSHSGTVPDSSLILKNNIFYLAKSTKVNSAFSGTSFIHENNVYRISNGASIGYTLGASELNTSSSLFTSTSNTDAVLWDYHLPAGSVAINFGQNLGLVHDIQDIAVSGLPDAGCYETGGAVIVPISCSSFVYGSWSTCNNSIQTRSYTALPAGCTGVPPTDSISRACTMSYLFTYGSWFACAGGFQTRSYTSNPLGGTPPVDSVKKACVSSDSASYFYYSAAKKSVHIDYPKPGAMLIMTPVGFVVQKSNYAAYGAWVNVSKLPSGIYIATTYGFSMKFNK